MKKILFRLFVLSLPLTSMLVGIAYADCIPISSLPYTITQGGSYCLTADLSGGVIEVKASHVDLDFQGHTITNGTVDFTVPAPTATDLTVHNGTINGDGLTLEGYENQVVSDITVDHMTVSSAGSHGISVSASDVKITNNVVTGTRNINGVGLATGIEILGNIPPGSIVSNRAVVQGNTVANTSVGTASSANYPPTAIGIDVRYYADVLISGNTVVNAYIPKQFPTGIAVGINVDATNGFCAHADCTSPQLGGLIVQNNNVSVTRQVIGLLGVAHNSVGIKISHAPDHAIVTGSTISSMDTGIDASVSWPGTPPVLLLDSSFTQVTAPAIGGVTLPSQ